MKMFANGEARLSKGNPVGSPVKWFKAKELERNNNYIISSNGSIFSKRRHYKRLSPKNNWDGYKRIQLWNKNKNNYVSIHILVAETFIMKPVGAEVVNHKDLNKGNNNARNLEWITQKENINHAMKHNPNASQVKKRKKITNGEKIFNSIKEAAVYVGRDQSTISHAVTKGTKCAGYYWKPVSTNRDECSGVE